MSTASNRRVTQEAADAWLVSLLQDPHLAAIHAQRIKIQCMDFELTRGKVVQPAPPIPTLFFISANRTSP
ncbi:hypothetical protein NMY22_g10708 [Coprinellus aureogranulatus]|nr:hypothetical protein NMY22_g10708 [Coprinellus aureogranulatus]